jgi:uncharacterized SAM-binding protein YcdF (DUF218 family)
MARLFRTAAFILLVSFAAGFVLFVREARSFSPSGDVSADAIVVLTGGPGRVSTGVSLLEAGRGERLLISGINPGSPIADIAAAAGASQTLFECCVDVGPTAADTEGNAVETAAWARSRGYGALIVVTSDYHMPRALLELQAAMPDTRLEAYGVAAPEPWQSADEARRWLTEYVKYAAVYGRERVMGLFSAADAGIEGD